MRNGNRDALETPDGRGVCTLPWKFIEVGQRKERGMSDICQVRNYVPLSHSCASRMSSTVLLKIICGQGDEETIDTLHRDDDA